MRERNREKEYEKILIRVREVVCITMKAGIKTNKPQHSKNF